MNLFASAHRVEENLRDVDPRVKEDSRVVGDKQLLHHGLRGEVAVAAPAENALLGCYPLHPALIEVCSAPLVAVRAASSLLKY